MENTTFHLLLFICRHLFFYSLPYFSCDTVQYKKETDTDTHTHTRWWLWPLLGYTLFWGSHVVKASQHRYDSSVQRRPSPETPPATRDESHPGRTHTFIHTYIYIYACVTSHPHRSLSDEPRRCLPRPKKWVVLSHKCKRSFY